MTLAELDSLSRQHYGADDAPPNGKVLEDRALLQELGVRTVAVSGGMSRSDAAGLLSPY